MGAALWIGAIWLLALAFGDTPAVGPFIGFLGLVGWLILVGMNIKYFKMFFSKDDEDNDRDAY